MIVVKNESIIPIDIDSTLILPIDENKFAGRKVDVYDSVTKKFIKMIAHEPNIRLLREEHHRGSYIVVWSKGGYEWASNVIKALDLVPYVDIIMSKPKTYIDDTPVKKWMKDRIWLSPDMAYKK